VAQIDHDAPVLRARRTAASTRAALGIAGIVLILAHPSLLTHPALGLAGFAVIETTATIQLLAPRMAWLKIEESLAGAAAVLIVGLQDQQVTVLSVLWLAAVSSGVMARGGRVHWIGRAVVLSALALPIIRLGALSADYATLCLASVGLLLTSGRLMRELGRLLQQARYDAESAESLLLAGDIALRVAKRSEEGNGAGALGGDTPRDVRHALSRLIAGDGLSMAVQPIVELSTGSAHAYEALARFGPAGGGSPLPWFAAAEKLGQRGELERACLRAALDLLSRRPAGALLSVNLSAPVLFDPCTLQALARPHDLSRLIIEITEETLVASGDQLHAAIAPLRQRGALLAVDDMGAGYSGLRQITTVRPDYLKLDRSLVSGIDRDGDRAALVSALLGYAVQTGSLLIAEGVESDAELRRLRELHVPLAQGFYLGRPAPPWPAVLAQALPGADVVQEEITPRGAPAGQLQLA